MSCTSIEIDAFTCPTYVFIIDRECHNRSSPVFRSRGKSTLSHSWALRSVDLCARLTVETRETLLRMREGKKHAKILLHGAARHDNTRHAAVVRNRESRTRKSTRGTRGTHLSVAVIPMRIPMSGCSRAACIHITPAADSNVEFLSRGKP